MSEARPWRIEVSSRAEKELKRMPSAEQARVKQALDGLRVAPERGDVRKLTGRASQSRLRVGDYRVIFARDDEARAIVVLHVLPRGRAYRGV
jgi:mRNA interferase RelE/StbE